MWFCGTPKKNYKLKVGFKRNNPAYDSKTKYSWPRPLANIKNSKMKIWRITLKGSPNEISEKLEKDLKSIGGFVFNINRKKSTSVTFKLRKRVLYVWYWAFQNWTIVNGELLRNNTEDTTDVEITFNQHWLIKLLIFTHIILVLGLLITIIYGININSSVYILESVLIALGIILWIALQRKFKKDIQKYKSVITEIFVL